MVDGFNPYRQFCKEPSWSLTLGIQVILCLGLYAAFNIGKPQEAATRRRESTDLYFLSVRGGSRPHELQSRLLHQMEKTAKTYKAKFVLVVGELGENDPLRHNDFLYEEQKSKLFREEIGWLKQTLALSDSNWRIIVGFDPLIICSENKVNKTKRIKFYEPFRHIFLRYGVNAYLSTQGCAGYFYHDGPTMYIGNPGPADETQVVLSASKSLNFTSELQNGFLLHRVTPLEIESYMIDSEGRVAFRSTLHHHGRGAI